MAPAASEAKTKATRMPERGESICLSTPKCSMSDIVMVARAYVVTRKQVSLCRVQGSTSVQFMLGER
jgi:hypothetical protein